MCFLPRLIHQLWFGFHPPPVSATYRSSHFLATFQWHSELKAKVPLGWVRETSQFATNYATSDRCEWSSIVRSGRVEAAAVCPRWQLGWVTTSARRACLLYCQRWCENDEMESGCQERGERRQRQIDMNVFYFCMSWNDVICINHIMFPFRLFAIKQDAYGEAIYVTHVVITCVEHGFAPSGPSCPAAVVASSLEQHCPLVADSSRSLD